MTLRLPCASAPRGSKRHSSHRPDYPERKEENSADEFEDQTQGKAKNPEGKQDQPKNWKEEQQEQGQWPTHDEQYKPKYKCYKSFHFRGCFTFHMQMTSQFIKLMVLRTL